MLRPLPAENVEPWLTIMFIGVWFLFVRFVWGTVAITQRMLEDRKAKKLAMIARRYKEITPDAR